MEKILENKDCMLFQRISELLEWQKKQEEQVKLAEEFSSSLKLQLKQNGIQLDESNNNLNEDQSVHKQFLFDITEESFENGLPLDPNKFSEKKQIKCNKVNVKTSLNEKLIEKNFLNNNEKQNYSTLVENKMLNLFLNENNDKNLSNNLKIINQNKLENYLNSDEFLLLRKSKNFDLKKSEIDKQCFNLTIENSLNSNEIDLEPLNNCSFSQYNIRNQSWNNQSFNLDSIDKSFIQIKTNNKIINSDNVSIKPGIDGKNVKNFNDLVLKNLNKIESSTGKLNENDLYLNNLNENISFNNLNEIKKSFNNSNKYDLTFQNLDEFKLFSNKLNLNNLIKINSNEENQIVKKPFLRKRSGLKRFQNLTIEQNKSNNQASTNLKKKKDKINLTNHDRQLRLEYLSQPKNKNFCQKFSSKQKNEVKTNQIQEQHQVNQVKQNNLMNFKKENRSNECLDDQNKKMTGYINEIENLNNFYQQNDLNKSKIFRKSEPNLNAKENDKLINRNQFENQIQMVSNLHNLKKTHSKLNKNALTKSNFIINETKSKQQNSNDQKLELLLETFIDLFEQKKCSKKTDSLKNLLKDKLNKKLNEKLNDKNFQKKNFDNFNFDENEFDETDCFEYEQESNISKNKNQFQDNLLNVPRIGMQTLALRNRIEFIQRRLLNLQEYCDQAENYWSNKSNLEDQQVNYNQNFSNKKSSIENLCQCNYQIDDLKSKLDSISTQLKNLDLNFKSVDKDSRKNLNATTSQSVLDCSTNKELKSNSNLIPPKKTLNCSNRLNNMNKTKNLNLNEDKKVILNSKINPENKLRKPSVYLSLDDKLSSKPNSKSILVHKNMESEQNKNLLKTTNNSDDFKVVEYKDGLRIIEKKDGHLEKIYPNGNHEIFFTDGTIIRTLSDGTKIVDFSNGEREICTNSYKRREFVDGTIKTIYTDGTKETRYSSGRIKIRDKHGNIIADSRIFSKLNQANM